LGREEKYFKSSNGVDLLKETTKLRILRGELGMSQREMAKEFKVSPGAIAHWESGKRKVSDPVLKLMEIYCQDGNVNGIS